MLGDIVYESGRGIAPDYLRFLGASAFVVGVASGAGEFIGYTLRLLSGSLADRTKAYWLFMFLGYGLILSIPLIGFTASIELVVALTLLERLGKALRSPSRDTVVSIVSRGIGSGKAFGLHELIDQVGAIIGPLLVGGIMLYTANNYSITYQTLILPFVLMTVTLVYTHGRIGKSVEAESAKASVQAPGLSRDFWIYCTAVFLNTVGLIPVALLLFKASTILQPSGQQWLVPILYVVVQLIDAPMAFVSGMIFDKIGVKVLAAPFALSVLPALFISGGGLSSIIIACAIFGTVLGMQESIYRAAIAELVPMARRGTAYGLFNTILGLGTLASSMIYGFFMDTGVPTVVIFAYALAAQACALLALRTGKTAILERTGSQSRPLTPGY
jgi:MFS family permease